MFTSGCLSLLLFTRCDCERVLHLTTIEQERGRGKEEEEALWCRSHMVEYKTRIG